MIQVAIDYQDQDIKTLTVQGHAQSAVWGQDLVCAGVSAIMNGAFNALDHLTPNQVELVVGDNLLKVEVKKTTESIKQLLELIHIQLATIAHQYPQNIQIREVH